MPFIESMVDLSALLRNVNICFSVRGLYAAMRRQMLYIIRANMFA